jgi:hypothetical protein
MVNFLQKKRSAIWLAVTAAAGLVLFALALTALMLPYSRAIEESGGKDLTCLHVPFTRARAAAIIDSYDDEARAAARALHFPGDTLFPVGYALLYGGLIGLVARQQEGRWLRVGAAVMLFPAAAMIFDWIENLFIVRMLTVSAGQSSAVIPGWMPLLGGLAGSIKYILLAIITPLYGIAAIARSPLHARAALSAGVIITYLIAFALLAFNFVQVVTGVLPCLGPL